MLKENHRTRGKCEAGGYQQERGVADGLLNGDGFFFRIFGLSSVIISLAVRYASSDCATRTDFRQSTAYWFRYAAGKISFAPDSRAPQSRMPSASRGKLLRY